MVGFVSLKMATEAETCHSWGGFRRSRREVERGWCCKGKASVNHFHLCLQRDLKENWITTVDEILCQSNRQLWRSIKKVSKLLRSCLQQVRSFCPGILVTKNLISYRARVLYELTQYPKLRAQLPGTLLDLLSAALEASRFALSLKQDNADILLYVVHKSLGTFHG